MSMLPLLPIAIAETQKRLDSIAAEQWTLPTPCEGWDVKELAAHLLGGARMATILLAGGSKEDVEAGFASAHQSTDPAADFAAFAAEELANFNSAPSLDVVVNHPAMPMPASQMLQFKISDYTVHAWDLARALGVDETLDPTLVDAVWTALQPMVPMIAHVGVFGAGPSGTVAEDAPLQTRLLDTLGRRP
jgi:uncharacterized protein (TIGR03086 family)